MPKRRSSAPEPDSRRQHRGPAPASAFCCCFRFPFLYPVAGAAAAAWGYGFYKLTNAHSYNAFLVLILVFVAPIGVLVYMKRWEAKVAVRFRFYRYLRAVIRFAAVTVFSALLFSAGGHNGPSPGQNLAAFLVAVFSQIFIFPRLDRWEREGTET